MSLDVNAWFCSLPQERQKVLRDDKWLFANAAFKAGAGDDIQVAETGFQTWFDALPVERQEILREDKWMLAGASFNAGLCFRNESLTTQSQALNQCGQ